MINGKHLAQWGLPQGQVYGIVLSFINNIDLHRKQAQRIIQDMVKNPHDYITDETWGEAARLLLPVESKEISLNDDTCPLTIYGKGMIEQGALDQIDIASRLPVSLRAACMPDGHQGYGLPIGGVLAVDNAVIPYAVGVDIGCRMHMTIMDIPFHDIKGQKEKLAKIVVDNTIFGMGDKGVTHTHHPVLEDENFRITKKIKSLRPKAINQIGSSGSGNHFVNLGWVTFPQDGIYEPRLAILSHSGSRGMGSKIAKIYTDIAMDLCCLPSHAKHLAWLDMDSEAGQEYWAAMNLAGDYAKANHEVLHARIVKALGGEVHRVIQNHHNFAWKEQVTLADGTTKEAIVHRKGATPAGAGVIGLIPGSMTTPSYIAKGLGSAEAVNSSSHGAGRMMSRKHAKEQLTMSFMRQDLERQGVTLIGGSLDECSAAYKDIRKVMAQQTELVEIAGEFTPWIVRMAEDQPKPWDKKKKQKVVDNCGGI